MCSLGCAVADGVRSGQQVAGVVVGGLCLLWGLPIWSKVFVMLKGYMGRGCVD